MPFARDPGNDDADPLACGWCACIRGRRTRQASQRCDWLIPAGPLDPVSSPTAEWRSVVTRPWDASVRATSATCCGGVREWQCGNALRKRHQSAFPCSCAQISERAAQNIDINPSGPSSLTTNLLQPHHHTTKPPKTTNNVRQDPHLAAAEAHPGPASPGTPLSSSLLALTPGQGRQERPPGAGQAGQEGPAGARRRARRRRCPGRGSGPGPAAEEVKRRWTAGFVVK
jgi:hypothetical protein